MKAFLLFVSILFSVVCSAQYNTNTNFIIGSSGGQGDTAKNIYIGNTAIGYGSITAPVKITGSCCVKIGYDYPAFKEEKCIVIYLDGLEVKADSAIKYYRADTSKYDHSINPNKMTDLGNGLFTTTAMAYLPQLVPDWNIFKVIRKNKKEIPLQSIIQYK